MPQSLCPDAFLNAVGPVLDVRSPAEYDQGHIPGAQCFPLFTNDERAAVGTCYKQEGRDQAIALGLKFVGPKLYDFVMTAKGLAPDGVVRVHCWRGGMRSGSMAWLLETAGLEVSVLEGGYKAFRRWGRSHLAQPKPILILGGMTGTGKTAILHALAEHGQQILDLEGWANHRGSSYGALGQPPQPTTEQFENTIMVAWASLGDRQPIWIEAESRMVGRCRIPNELFGQMERAPVVEIVRSPAERIAYLQREYGSIAPEILVKATERIRKRLGGQRTQEAIDAIEQGNLGRAIALVLEYYDKTYRYDLQRRRVPYHSLDATGFSPGAIAQSLSLLATGENPPNLEN